MVTGETMVTGGTQRADSDLEELAAYHPLEFPPRMMHAGPSASEMDARGMPYFRLGHAGVTRITRRPSNGDVYIHRKNQPALLHTSRAWAVLVDESKALE
jgi:hypothetical protein